MEQIEWSVKRFDELTLEELYAILKVRSEVFVVEQQCCYLDLDSLDQISLHLFTKHKNEILAYCRIVPKGIRFADICISRVITAPKARRSGLGRALIKQATHYITEELGEETIRLSGQAYLQNFYESLGFQTASGRYLEDNIPHYEMVFQKK